MPGFGHYLETWVDKRIDTQLRPAVEWSTDAMISFTVDGIATLDGLLASEAHQRYVEALKSAVAAAAVLRVQRAELIAAPNIAQESGVRWGADGVRIKKRLVILKRANDLDVTAYRSEWWGVHAKLVSALPAVQGYYGNHVDESRILFYEPGSSPSIHVDNVVELWFADEAEMRRSLPADGPIQAHAKSIHDQMSIATADERCL
jgi:hypothetical protein